MLRLAQDTQHQKSDERLEIAVFNRYLHHAADGYEKRFLPSSNRSQWSNKRCVYHLAFQDGRE